MATRHIKLDLRHFTDRDKEICGRLVGGKATYPRSYCSGSRESLLGLRETHWRVGNDMTGGPAGGDGGDAADRFAQTSGRIGVVNQRYTASNS